jgi:lactose/L-arabinose transport system ATP-binding protein
MASVELSQVKKTFGNVNVIHGVDLTIDHGEFTVFVGPSGCGKSTLLRMIAGLEEVSSGELKIGGERMNEVEPSERGVAMVFQSYALYPHMTVEENMGFGLRMTGTPKAEIAARVKAASDILQLGPYLQRKPSQLSGGQRQRVAIGRAIVRNPKVFLFDEPLSNLDAELRVAMRVEIAKLHQDLGNTMIYVTHDQTEAMTLADKIVVLRAGKVEQVGSPLTLYDDPDNVFVAGFIGSPKMNFMAGTAVEGGDGRQVRLAGGAVFSAPLTRDRLAPGTAVQVGVRPEHFDRDAAPDVRLPVKVDVVENLGGTSFIYGRTAAGEAVIVERRDGQVGKAGETVEVGFRLAHVRLFGADGKRLR